MQRNTTMIIGVVLVIIIILGGFWWWLASVSQPTANTDTSTPSSSETTDSTGTSSSDQGSSVSPTTSPGSESAASSAQVTIQGQAFIPAKITVKKGTKVTWTNNDSMGHNVVSDDNAPVGGPPKDASLINKGETFEFTFNTVGTFPYHCSPHPFMKGTVEVIE